MSRGWQEHRLEPDGRWQATGQLRDDASWPPPQFLHPINGMLLTPVSGVDTNGVSRVFQCLAAPGRPPGLGTLGWARFSRP